MSTNLARATLKYAPSPGHFIQEVLSANGFEAPSRSADKYTLMLLLPMRTSVLCTLRYSERGELPELTEIEGYGNHEPQISGADSRMSLLRQFGGLIEEKLNKSKLNTLGNLQFRKLWIWFRPAPGKNRHYLHKISPRLPGCKEKS
ncbi:extracellular gdsl-like lipase [Moniliophthora roreri]|nr:extracellular gdsl-like lipase [Moniliophthora roreri]